MKVSAYLNKFKVNKMAEETKERILEAALKLFSEKGYLGATTKEIARVSGISEVTLFRYFQSKEKLFISVLEHYSFLPKIRELTRDFLEWPIEEALKLLAKSFLNALKSKKELIRIMLSEFPRYPEMVKEAYHKTIEKIIEELAQYFKRLQNEGYLKSSIPSIFLARAFLGLFFSYFHAVEIKGLNFGNSSEEEIINQYVALFLYGASKDFSH